jgi:hypothetical protein
MASDPRLKGLSFQQASQVLAQATGFKPLERFTKNAAIRAADYAGNLVTETGMRASPADLTARFGGLNMSGQGSDAMEVPFSERTGDLLQGASRMFGAEDDTQQAFRTAGEGIPAIAGQMAMGALGPVGLAAMLGTQYGQGVGQAYDQGEMGMRAQVSGAIAPLTTMATIGFARPLAGKAADVVMKTSQKMMGKSAGDVIREGMEMGGELGLRKVLQNKAIDAGTKVLLKTGQEALVETAQAGIGIGGEMASAAVLDPKEFITNTMWDKQFWIPVITSEILEGVGGTVIGRMRNPLVENEQETPPTIEEQIKTIETDAAARGVKAEALKNDPELQRLKAEERNKADMAAGKFNAPLWLMPDNPTPGPGPTTLFNLYAPLEAEARGIDPADPKADEKIINTDATTAQVASSSTTAALADARTAPEPVMGEDGVLVPQEAQVSTHVTQIEAVAEAASAVIGKGDVTHTANPLPIVSEALGAAPKSAAKGVTPAQAKANWMERVRDGSLKNNKDHRILTDDADPSNHVSFRNPGTHEVGVLTHLVRKGQVINPINTATGKKTILTTSDMVKFAFTEQASPVTVKAMLDQHFGTELTPAETESILGVARKVSEQQNTIPYGVSFGDSIPANYKKQWLNFMLRSGLQDALVRSKVKLRFGETAYKMNANTLKNSPLDYFASIDLANNTQFEGINLHYISRNRGNARSPKTEYETDLHEVGHTVGHLIRNGAFGEDVKAQWDGAMAEALRISQDDKYANEVGIKIALDVVELSGYTPAVGSDPAFAQYKHFRTLHELEAQTFQGYMLGKDTPWKSFIAKHFPRLHKFFSDFMAKLGLPSDTEADLAKKMDRYSANFREGEMVLKGIFNNHYKNVYNGKKRLQELKRKYRLNGTQASAALDTAWLEANQYMGHSTINDALAAWSKGLPDPENLSEVDVAEIQDLLEYVKKFNQINYQGFTSISDAVTAMPWVSRLQANDSRLELLRERLVYHAQDPKKVAEINKRLLAPDLLESAKNVSKDIIDRSRDSVQRANKLLNARDQFALSLRFVARGVDELFAQQGEYRVRAGQVAKQMFQVDAVVKKWFLGQLPGQGGIPMHEPNSQLTSAELATASKKYKATTKEERPEFLRTIHKWYPILTKELQSITDSRSKFTTYLSSDGTFRFADEKSKRNKERKYFATKEDAEAQAMIFRQQPGNEMLKFTFEQSKGKATIGQWLMKITRTNAEQTESTFIDDFDPDAAQSFLAEMVGPSETANPIAEQRAMSPDDFEMTPAGKNIAQAKQAFAAIHGPQVMAKASVFAPIHINYYRESRILPDALWSTEASFQVAFKTRAQVQKDVTYLARELGITELVTDPFQVVDVWLDKQLGENAAKVMPELERHLNQLDPDLENYIHSYVNYAKKYVNEYIDYEMGKWLRQESNNLIPVDPSERNAGARAANNSVMMQPDVRAGVTAAMRSLPGGVTASPTILKSSDDTIRRIFGTVPKTLQTIHGFMGQGPIHWSMTDPDFVKLGDFIHSERGFQQAMADEAISPLFVEGDMKDFNENGATVSRFVPRDGGKIDKNSPILIIRADPKKEEMHNDIILLEQLGHMPFAQQLVSTAENVRKPAQELFARIPESERDLHFRALERRYTSQRFRAAREIAADQANHTTSFAYLISLDNVFDNNADRIHEYATQFAHMSTEERVASLVQDLNKTPEQANELALKYGEHEVALLEKSKFMWEHPEYVDERRMKNYHVSVVFKGGYKSKTGVKHRDDTPLTGYFDFNTLNGEDGEEGAYQFIARMKQEGHKVMDHPKDFNRQRWNYKPVSGSLEDIMVRVVESRKMLVETLLYGKVPPKDLDRIIGVMDNTVQDILQENDVVVASKTDIVKRKFAEGRENLDMMEQFMNSTRRKAAAVARRRTDMMFKLYGRDQRMLKKPEMLTKMEQFKDGVRLKDTDAQRNISAIGFTMFMGGNISSGLVELFQFPITLSPILMEAGVSMKDAWGIPAKLYRRATSAAIARAMGKDDSSIWVDKKLDPHGEIIGVLREAEKRGIMAQLRHHDISTSNIDKYTEMYQGRTRELGVVGTATNLARHTYDFMNKTYGAFNRVNSELGIAGTYLALKKQKYGLKKQLSLSEIDELQTEAFKLSDVANGSLQRLGRPGMFNTRDPGTRNVLSAYWSLQSFVNAQVANQIRFISKSIDSDRQWTLEQRKAARKATVALFGVQFAGLGVMGFTLMPSISKLVEQLFGVDMEDALRDALYDESGENEIDKNFMGEMASNGILSAMDLPIDYGSRISVAGVGPLSGFDGINPAQLGGPLVGLATQAFKDVGKIKAGNMSLGEGAINLLPMGLRRAARLAFVDDGKVYDANKRFLYEPDAAETIGMVAGFTPLRSRKEMKSRMEQFEAIESEKTARTRLYNQINNAPNPMQRNILIDRMTKDYDMTAYEVAQNAAEVRVNQEMGPNVREGRGPKAIMAAKLYPSPLGDQQHEERLIRTARQISNLGFQPRTSSRSLMNARMMDAAQSLHPELPVRVATDMLRNDPMMRGQIRRTQPASMRELLQGVEFE